MQDINDAAAFGFQIESWETVSLYVRYNAGSAGVGWPSDTARLVRIPFVGTVLALTFFDAVTRGEAPFSGLAAGIVPDHARLVIENRTYPAVLPRGARLGAFTLAVFNRSAS